MSLAAMVHLQTTHQYLVKVQKHSPWSQLQLSTYAVADSPEVKTLCGYNVSFVAVLFKQLMSSSINIFYGSTLV